MTSEEFKKEVLKVTLKSVDKDPKDWVTFNDKINTKIIYDNFNVNGSIELLSNELPLLKCELENSYLLITTDRVISVVDDKYDDIFIEQMDKILIDFESKNFKMINDKYPKIHTIVIKKKNGNQLTFYIDSGYPSSFSTILIYNIFSHKTLGRWYVNPK